MIIINCIIIILTLFLCLLFNYLCLFMDLRVWIFSNNRGELSALFFVHSLNDLCNTFGIFWNIRREGGVKF